MRRVLITIIYQILDHPILNAQQQLTPVQRQQQLQRVQLFPEGQKPQIQQLQQQQQQQQQVNFQQQPNMSPNLVTQVSYLFSFRFLVINIIFIGTYNSGRLRLPTSQSTASFYRAFHPYL